MLACAYSFFSQKSHIDLKTQDESSAKLQQAMSSPLLNQTALSSKYHPKSEGQLNQLELGSHSVSFPVEADLQRKAVIFNQCAATI